MGTNLVVKGIVVFIAALAVATSLPASTLFACECESDCGNGNGCARECGASCVCGGDNSVAATPGLYVWNFGETTGGTSVNNRTGEAFMLNPSGLIPVFGYFATGTCTDFGLPKPLFPEQSLLRLGFEDNAGVATALPSTDRYKVAVFDGFLFDDFEAATYFRIEGTTRCQAVGLVFGCQGEEFYIARVGSEDDTATLYRYHDGKKYRLADAPVAYDEKFTLTEKWTDIARFENECELYNPKDGGVVPGTWTADADVTWGTWHELRIRRDRGVIDVLLDGDRLIRCLDLALRYGKIGFFVKGDTEAYFAGMAVRAW